MQALDQYNDHETFCYGIQHPKKRAFLMAFCESCNITEACAASGIDRTTHYRWVKEDSDYAEAFQEAHKIAVRVLEDEAVKRAKAGSDTLTIFLLKSYNPKVFGDRTRIDVHVDSAKFAPCAFNAFRKTCEQFGIPCTDELLKAYGQAIDEELQGL